jgi:hypothetical protein
MRLSKEGAARRPPTGQPGGELFSPWGNDTAGFPGYASDLKAAVAADLAGNYAEALQFYRKIEAAAVRVNDEEDISIVRAKIAQHYEKGLGVEQSYSTAAKLYEQAPSSARASLRLGFLYANGLGVPRDTAKARELLRVAESSSTGKSYLVLLDHNMLPKSPEGVTPAYVEAAKQKIAAIDAKRAADEAQTEKAAQDRLPRQHAAQRESEHTGESIRHCEDNCLHQAGLCDWKLPFFSVTSLSFVCRANYDNCKYDCERAQH